MFKFFFLNTGKNVKKKNMLSLSLSFWAENYWSLDESTQLAFNKQ